ncbi:MAG: glycerol-3-phosphate 1-O-acyltransferase PlsY [Lentimicrobiaceae bacterium]|nr:glycerol-3-phosphate 1-O-acyltransferase PlsY [Lentimicrobiaceae bacterium]
MNIVFGIILSYLVGSFSSAYWIGKWFFGINVKEEGSKNAGATNTFRLLGTAPAIIVLLIDFAKAFLAVKYIPYLFENTSTLISNIDYQIILGFAVVIGHVLPIFSNFKGGKGVASLIGVAIALYNPIIIAIILVLFVAVVAISNFISLGSITAAITLPILTLIFQNDSLSLIIAAFIIAVFVVFMHRKNIKRLINGNENKFISKKNKH